MRSNSASAAETIATGSGVQSAVAGEPATFHILARDAWLNTKIDLRGEVSSLFVLFILPSGLCVAGNQGDRSLPQRRPQRSLASNFKCDKFGITELVQAKIQVYRTTPNTVKCDGKWGFVYG